MCAIAPVTAGQRSTRRRTDVRQSAEAGDDTGLGSVSLDEDQSELDLELDLDGDVEHDDEYIGSGKLPIDSSYTKRMSNSPMELLIKCPMFSYGILANRPSLHCVSQYLIGLLLSCPMDSPAIIFIHRSDFRICYPYYVND